jgi:hypothetical protein
MSTPAKKSSTQLDSSALKRMLEIVESLPNEDEKEFATTFLNNLTETESDAAIARSFSAANLSPAPPTPMDRWFASAGANGMQVACKKKFEKWCASPKVARSGPCLLYGDKNHYVTANIADLFTYVHVVACFQKDDTLIEKYITNELPHVSHLCSHKHCIEPGHVFLESASDNNKRSKCQNACDNSKCDAGQVPHCGVQPPCVRFPCVICKSKEDAVPTSKKSNSADENLAKMATPTKTPTKKASTSTKSEKKKEVGSTNNNSSSTKPKKKEAAPTKNSTSSTSSST